MERGKKIATIIMVLILCAFIVLLSMEFATQQAYQDYKSAERNWKLKEISLELKNINCVITHNPTPAELIKINQNLNEINMEMDSIEFELKTIGGS